MHMTQQTMPAAQDLTAATASPASTAPLAGAPQTAAQRAQAGAAAQMSPGASGGTAAAPRPRSASLRIKRAPSSAAGMTDAELDAGAAGDAAGAAAPLASEQAAPVFSFGAAAGPTAAAAPAQPAPVFSFGAAPTAPLAGSGAAAGAGAGAAGASAAGADAQKGRRCKPFASKEADCSAEVHLLVELVCEILALIRTSEVFKGLHRQKCVHCEPGLRGDHAVSDSVIDSRGSA